MSEDGTNSWRLATAKDLVVNTIAALPGVLLIGTDGAGVLRSTDAGRSFGAANSGFSEHLISRVLVGRESGRLFVGISGDRFHSGVLTAARLEGPWTKLGEGLEGRELLALTLAGSELLAGTDDGVFLSVSHCGTWRRPPHAARRLGCSPARRRRGGALGPHVPGRDRARPAALDRRRGELATPEAWAWRIRSPRSQPRRATRTWP